MRVRWANKVCSSRSCLEERERIGWASDLGSCSRCQGFGAETRAEKASRCRGLPTSLSSSFPSQGSDCPLHSKGAIQMLLSVWREAAVYSTQRRPPFKPPPSRAHEKSGLRVSESSFSLRIGSGFGVLFLQTGELLPKLLVDFVILGWTSHCSAHPTGLPGLSHSNLCH